CSLFVPMRRAPRSTLFPYTTLFRSTVFKYAVSGMADVSEKIMQRNGLTKEDVNWLVAHQANKRIIDATAQRMGLDESKVLINIRSEEHTSELQSRENLVCRLLLEKK